MIRLSALWRIALVMAGTTATLQSLGAQQIRPVAVVQRSASAVGDGASGVPNVSLPPGSRSRHVVIGFAAGAVGGGIFGLTVDLRDKSGDGFIPAVWIGLGAILGGLIGTLVGLVWPTG